MDQVGPLGQSRWVLLSGPLIIDAAMFREATRAQNQRRRSLDERPPVVKQILPELLVADHQRQISIRCRDQADIDMNIPASTP